MPKGYKPPKSGGQAGMMKQLQKMQAELLAAQQNLANEVVHGSSGGGAVKVSVTGDQRCQSVVIDPMVFSDGDVELLQDLVLTAFNQAIENSHKLAQDRLGPLTGGMGL